MSRRYTILAAVALILLSCVREEQAEEPVASYGSKVKLSEVAFQPMPQMMETLRAQGYITHEEFVNRIISESIGV